MKGTKENNEPVLGKLLHEELVQLGTEHTISNELM
jgi:hypothetical protein